MEAARVKFYNLSLQERARWIAGQAGLTADEVAALTGAGGLTLEQADHMIENVVGLHALPLGIAQNFLVNGREVLVPMADRRAFGGGGRFLYGAPGAPGGRLYRAYHRPGDDRADAGPRPGQPRAGAPDAAGTPGGTAGGSRRRSTRCWRGWAAARAIWKCA